MLVSVYYIMYIVHTCTYMYMYVQYVCVCAWYINPHEMMSVLPSILYNVYIHRVTSHKTQWRMPQDWALGLQWVQWLLG